MTVSNPAYQESYGVSWRATGVPGMLAIPCESITEDPIAIIRFMRLNWPLFAEHDLKTIGGVAPYRARHLMEPGQLLPEPLSIEHLRQLGTVAVFNDLLEQKAAVSVSIEDKPRLILLPQTEERRQEVEADFAELFQMDEERIAAGEFTVDPESGVAFANQVLLDPLGQDLLADIQRAHERRIARGEAG